MYLPWPPFKVAAFQKNCSLETILTDFKTCKISPGQFSKALGAALRNLLLNRSQQFELAGFQKLFAH
jgi:hypothetical protein